MTITQLIQASPAKANELFTKLADTSDGALKTRERLFSELKEELETLAALEEKHLFPVLRKHQETKDLVAEAINDNKEVRKLLADLDKTGKTDPEFAPKLAELRKVFQSHVRDEKKELLPAVRKALSTEEAQAIVEKIETGRADAVEEKKAEGKKAEEKKAEVKDRVAGAKEAAERTGNGGGRKIAEAAEKMTEAASGAATAPLEAAAESEAPEIIAEAAEDLTGTVAEAATAAADTASQVAETASQVAGTSLKTLEAGAIAAVDAGRAVTDATRTVAEAGAETAAAAGKAVSKAASQAIGASARQVGTAVSSVSETTMAATEAAQPFFSGLSTLSNIPSASLDMAKDVGQVWSDLLRQNLETGARASQEMFRLNSPQQIALAQSRFSLEVMQSWMTAGTRIMQISLHASHSLKSATQQAVKEEKKVVSAGR